MTSKVLLSIVTTFFVVTSSFAQTEADNIEFLRVQNQINAGNYRKASNVLSNISVSGKYSTFYLSYRATCYEKLSIYDSAAVAYRQLYNKTKSFDAMKKIAEMKDKDDAKRNCERCHGTGSYEAIETCRSCNGTGLSSSKCNTCNGSGLCSNCNGKGYDNVSFDGGVSRQRVDCSFCKKKNENGQWECTNCDGKGYTSVMSN